MPTLTERRAEILALAVSEYIRTAEPVSSKLLADRSELGVSPATVRNEFALLENNGLLMHPYTSGGRVPTELGYRTYVEQLMLEEPVIDTERITVEHQLHQVAASLEEWLPLTTSILASWVGNVAVVLHRPIVSQKLLQAQLVDLNGESVLMVCVLDDGTVRKRTLSIMPSLDQVALNSHASWLNELLAGSDATKILELAQGVTDPLRVEFVRHIATLMREHGPESSGFIDGLEVALQQPEFNDQESMLEAMGYLSLHRLENVINGVMGKSASTSTRIVIGPGNSSNNKNGWSIVASSFEMPAEAGVIAVVGPTRMAYAHVLPRVRYLADLMSSFNQVGPSRSVED